MTTSRDKEAPGREKVVMATHCSHCGGTCLLKVHVKDDVITRIETDDGEDPQYRACIKGRAYRQRVYAPDRLLYPLKRVGERGEGKFRRVSWDEALETVAGELTRVRQTYGPEAVLFKWSGGDIGKLHTFLPHYRLLNMTGGCSEVWSYFSYEGYIFAAEATYGSVATSTTRDDLRHSRLIILWGCDPANTVLHTNTTWYLAQAREAGIRVVSVDPKYTDSTATFADEWIPIAPGTDAAMLIAMAYVMIKEDLHDQEFLDAYTVGFEQFRDYVLGVEDGVPKTPEWAEAITSVPATTIAGLAREYATTKPAALLAGIAPGRSAYGEQYHRAAITLACMTGNVGVPGGDAGASIWGGTGGNYPFMRLGRALKALRNPVEAEAPPRREALHYDPGLAMRPGRVHAAKLSEAILEGKAGGYPADYKALYVVNTSYPNQYLNVNKAVQALKKLEFVVMFEQFMTPGARFADVVLPVNTCLERNDITTGVATGFYGYMNKAIESLGESKPHLDIAMGLAEKLGVADFNDKTEDEWLRQVVDGCPDIADYDAFKKDGIHKIRRAEPYVAFQKEIEDPVKNPFPTPSGKIEIYSQQLADMENPGIPPIPKYIEPWEGPRDPLAKKYPLQLLTTHSKRRAHSQYDNLPWLRELLPQAVLMNADDARARGIKDGDTVRVFNDRGQMVIPARVTERITPGVVDVPQGAWYDPDDKGVDRGGCANILTKDAHSPGGAYPTNTSLVQVERA